MPPPDSTLTRLADLAYAAAMLKNTPRSGFAFLGTGRESVAEHSFGAAFLAYLLARRANADAGKTVLLCLFHDLHEAATGDFSYVNHRYDKADAQRALEDICAGSGFAEAILNFCAEFEAGDTLESRLANDADQLDLICALRQQVENGNQFASEWLKSALLRLKTGAGKALGQAIMTTSPHHWWYDQLDQSWWVNRETKEKPDGRD